MGDLITWIQTNWVQVVAGLWAIEQVLRIISPLTPWKWDDNLVSMLGKLLQKFFPKK